MNTSQLREKTGVALITTLAIVVVVGILVLGSVLTTQLELAVTRNDINATQAQYVTQAGLQTQKAALFQAYRYALTGEGSPDPCASSLDESIDLRIGESVAVWINDRIDLDSVRIEDGAGNLVGIYQAAYLRDPDRRNIVTIRSAGTATSDGSNIRARSTATATFILSTGSSIETAIFAGAGSGMRAINGNASVYGGIYIEGDRVAYFDPITLGSEPSVFDTSGSFAMLNSYDAATLDQGRYKPSELLNNPVETNLCASLRVGYGSVTVGQAVQLGTPDVPLQSVAVGQKAGNVTYSGDTISGDVDEFCKKNFGVCSVKGVTPFDLDDPPRYPILDEEPSDASLCPVGSTLWRNCIQDEAELDGFRWSASVASTSSGVLDPDECSALLAAAAASQDQTLVFGTSSIKCMAKTGDDETVGFEYTVGGPSNDLRGNLRVVGHVNLEGLNVRFDLPTEYDAISDRPTDSDAKNASFSVLAEDGNGGNIRVQSDFVPNPNTTTGKYPDVVLALVGEKDVIINGGSSTTVTAPVYAGNLFRIRANSTLIGQVITNSFCSMGNPGSDGCNSNGAPPTIIFKSAGDNRPGSYRAVATPGGTPVYELLSYEMR